MLRLIVPALLALGPMTASADWTLSAEGSKVAFGSVKKDAVGETHHFTGLSGGVDASGAARVEIDLSSAETWIDIRNERMAEHVFKGVGPAVLTADIDLAALEALKPGESASLDVKGTLTFGAVALPIEAPVFAARLSETRALIATDEIIWVSTADLGVTAGIDKLMELAELPSITRATPVTFRFVFDQGDAVAAARAAAAATPVQVASVEIAGDPEAGAKVFRKCKACHVADEAKNKVGPHLVGIIGRKAASVDGFKYSSAFEALDYDWTPERLSAYLAKPRDYVKGTKMAFAGLKKPADIENVLAYLASFE